jgi:hypothetical protein
VAENGLKVMAGVDELSEAEWISEKKKVNRGLAQNSFLQNLKWLRLSTKYQCCGSGFGSGSARIRNFLHDPEPDPDSELEIMDPDTELELNLTKIYQKN